MKEVQDNNIRLKELSKIIFNLERDLNKLNPEVVSIMINNNKKEIKAYYISNNLIHKDLIENDEN